MNENSLFESTTLASTAESAKGPAVDTTVEDSEAIEPISWSRFGNDPLPLLPKMAAVNRAYKAGVDFGLPEGFASALAHAVVDPAELRVALNHPTTMNVAGGAIAVIDIDLYVPGLVPLPTNNRTMDNRVYPASGAPGYLGPLSGPRSASGVTSELWVDAHGAEHAMEESKRGADHILAKNPLKDSVGERGIVMPVTVAYFELRHRDGQPAMPLLGAADGSSRIASAHALLNLTDPRTTLYEMPTNRDSYRRFVDSISSPDIESLSTIAAQRLKRQRNALITPARIFLRFTPQPNSSYSFAQAVAAYVGMLHVDPPRPWTPTGKLEAMAESVLEVLRSAQVLDDSHHDYLAGLLTPDAARAAGLPTLRDEQAAHVLATLLRPDLRELIERGIMDVTAKKSVTAPRRNDVIAELALRPTRSEAVTLPVGDATRDRSIAMRAAYLRATHFPLYAARLWKVTGRSPDELLQGALDELHRSEAEQSNPSAWQNRLELAALAQYHLTAHGALKREPVGNKTADQRGPQEILKLMLDDEQGVRLLRQAIVDGREGIVPRLVDEEGYLVRATPQDNEEGESGTDLPPENLTDEWLRYDGFPGGGRTIRPVLVHSETPLMKAARLQRHVLDLINQLESRLDELDHLEGPAGGVLLDQRGWPSSETKSALESLIEAQSRLGYWGKVADRQTNHNDKEIRNEYSEESEEDYIDSVAGDRGA